MYVLLCWIVIGDVLVMYWLCVGYALEMYWLGIGLYLLCCVNYFASIGNVLVNVLVIYWLCYLLWIGYSLVMY